MKYLKGFYIVFVNYKKMFKSLSNLNENTHREAIGHANKNCHETFRNKQACVQPEPRVQRVTFCNCALGIHPQYLQPNNLSLTWYNKKMRIKHYWYKILPLR